MYCMYIYICIYTYCIHACMKMHNYQYPSQLPVVPGSPSFHRQVGECQAVVSHTGVNTMIGEAAKAIQDASGKDRVEAVETMAGGVGMI